MARFGTADEGFEISVSTASRLLHLEAWGFWKTSLATTYQQEMHRAIGSLSGGGDWVFLGDLTAFKPQTPDVFSVQEQVMMAAHSGGVVYVAVVVKDAISKLQALRLAKRCGKDRWSFYESVAGAKAWLGKNGWPV